MANQNKLSSIVALKKRESNLYAKKNRMLHKRKNVENKRMLRN